MLQIDFASFFSEAMIMPLIFVAIAFVVITIGIVIVFKTYASISTKRIHCYIFQRRGGDYFLLKKISIRATNAKFAYKGRTFITSIDQGAIFYNPNSPVLFYDIEKCEPLPITIDGVKKASSLALSKIIQGDHVSQIIKATRTFGFDWTAIVFIMLGLAMGVFVGMYIPINPMPIPPSTTPIPMP